MITNDLAIIDAAIEILDAQGEGALTFRTLAGHLSTGSGAIYWHLADKNELLALGTVAQHAANARLITPDIDRATFLANIADEWARLDPTK